MERRHWIRSGPAGKARLGIFFLVISGLVAVLSAGAVLWEMRTSTLQSRWLTELASEISWELSSGSANNPVLSPDGPYDRRLGYSQLSGLVESASRAGFEVAKQATSSDRFLELVRDWGLNPVYREKTSAGLSILDPAGARLYEVRYPERLYQDFASIPPVVWQTLLFVEDRNLLNPDRPLMNPAIEWPRFLRSAAELGLRAIGREGSIAGASTLATQIEKFRHSPGGQTSTPRDKLTQMASASLRAYRDGPETLRARERVVTDYVNSVPLSAQLGQGEISGLGDGLWAWYGRDFEEANRSLFSLDPVGEGVAAAALGSEAPPASYVRADPGLVYREVLTLILSQRRPTYYLARPDGREELEVLTDRHLGLLEEANVISPSLADAARQARALLLSRSPDRPPVPFVERKGVNAVRNQLMGILQVPSLYDLDRLDLRVSTTIDAEAQRSVTDFIQRLADGEFVRERGLDGYRLLDRGDPSGVVYSVIVNERTDRGNLVRIQVDNLDEPFNLNESARLELGSTAKLRTLASYLEAVGDLHEAFSGVSLDSLGAVRLADRDALARWVRAEVLRSPSQSLSELLARSLQRTYSASPTERFLTGGGVQIFSNFDNTYNQRSITVSEAFQQSVNLVFVRMMRDVVNYYIYRQPGSAAHVLDETDSPLRMEYLQRFADREGGQFINQFFSKFEDRSRGAVLRALIRDRRLSPQRTAWAYRSVVPNASVEEFEILLNETQTDLDLTSGATRELFSAADPMAWDLADLGYLASVHPLELWLASYLIQNPGADRTEVLRASSQARQDVYRWLFRTRRQGAQDQRIRFLLEVEAFTEILEGWRKLGYPFSNIVPSLGTAIGSSGDRPAALGELVGVIINDGIRKPTYRIEALDLFDGTPFQTNMVRSVQPGGRVMRMEVAQTLRDAMVGVVREGTARRMNGVLSRPDGNPRDVGGKTGTGDNRYRTFGPGGTLLESRSVNRTSTLVFFVDDRLYGVVTAYVPGSAADDYWFTSALPTQILRELALVLEGLMAEVPEVSTSPAGPEGDFTGGSRQPLADDRLPRFEVEGAPGAESAGQR